MFFASDTISTVMATTYYVSLIFRLIMVVDVGLWRCTKKTSTCTKLCCSCFDKDSEIRSHYTYSYESTLGKINSSAVLKTSRVQTSNNCD